MVHRASDGTMRLLFDRDPAGGQFPPVAGGDRPAGPSLGVCVVNVVGVHRVKGPTILLGSGTYFDFEDPESSEITIEDVAAGLAGCSRFAGQCVSIRSGRRVRYSVAEHCVRGSRVAPPALRYPFLMHEAGEAVCGDMTGPLKTLVPNFRTIEKRCERAIMARFDVPEFDHDALKEIDLRMLRTEKRDLCPSRPEDSWSGLDAFEPYDDFDVVRPWDFEHAIAMFLSRFDDLRRGLP